MKTKQMYKPYGLVGRTINVRTNKLMAPSMLLDPSVIDPWRWGEQKAYVEYESPYFITVTILLHKAPHSWGKSTPYRTTIHKHDISRGEVILKDLDGNVIK